MIPIDPRLERRNHAGSFKNVLENTVRAMNPAHDRPSLHNVRNRLRVVWSYLDFSVAKEYTYKCTGENRRNDHLPVQDGENYAGRKSVTFNRPVCRDRGGHGIGEVK